MRQGTGEQGIREHGNMGTWDQGTGADSEVLVFGCELLDWLPDPYPFESLPPTPILKIG